MIARRNLSADHADLSKLGLFLFRARLRTILCLCHGGQHRQASWHRQVVAFCQGPGRVEVAADGGPDAKFATENLMVAASRIETARAGT